MVGPATNADDWQGRFVLAFAVAIGIAYGVTADFATAERVAAECWADTVEIAGGEADALTQPPELVAAWEVLAIVGDGA